MKGGLSTHVAIATRYARSANLERDSQACEVLAGYVLTGTTVDVVDRIAHALSGGLGGAWSITGPYGSGKSSLGLFLDALLGPKDSPSHKAASELLGAVAPDVSRRLADGPAGRLGRGLTRALVTARREPITHTVTRALQSAIVQRFDGMPTAKQFPKIGLLSAALDDMQDATPGRSGPAPGSIVELARALARESPLLLLIDELGKNLEAANERDDSDLYLLQLLAEAAHTERGSAILLVTMQHLGFGDYATSADTAQQREWAKIQGRFEDVAFIDSPAQTRELVRTVYSTSKDISKRVEKWAHAQSQMISSLGLRDLSNPELLAACYPLDPLVLGALPELCRRYGQNERTLFSFLTGPSVDAVPAVLADSEIGPSGQLPSVGLSHLYDFFVHAVTPSASLGGAARWNEIAVRLRDASGLDEEALRAAKSIAILNLITTSGPMRASANLLEKYLPNPERALAVLQAAGVITFRSTVDEYRIWQGTDLDLTSLVEVERARISAKGLVLLLDEVLPLTPVVAAGHSLRTDTMRVFEQRYADSATLIEPVPAHSPFDGRSYLIIDDQIELPALRTNEGKPVVVRSAGGSDSLREVALEAAALDATLKSQLLANDWVARREIGERLIDAKGVLARQIASASNGAAQFLVEPSGLITLEVGPGSTSLSDAANRVYGSAPSIRNETLNRADLTSQGAKARRILIEAMLLNSATEDLGLSGYGPEVAMYRAVLKSTGIHAKDTRSRVWVFRSPTDERMSHAWEAICNELERARTRRIPLNDLHAVLQLPPYGMKAGAIPVLITAVLIATSDEVAIYEHGTFRPTLSPDVAERMVRNPNHFELKHYANADGARRGVIEQLAQRFELPIRFRKQRVGNVLAIVAHLVNEISTLPTFSHRTNRLQAPTIAVRAAISGATEPDHLLFTALPAAVGCDPVPPTGSGYRHLSKFADKLVDALEDIRGAYDRLVVELQNEILTRAQLRDRHHLAGEAMSLEGEVLDPDLKAFVIALGVPDAVFDNRRWIENIAANVTRTAPRQWRDEDRKLFSSEVTGKLKAMRRLLVLHSQARTGSGPFEAHLFTRTASDGQDRSILVALTAEERERYNSELRPVLENLAQSAGSLDIAAHQLLGYLAELVLPIDGTPPGHTETSDTIHKVI